MNLADLSVRFLGSNKAILETADQVEKRIDDLEKHTDNNVSKINNTIGSIGKAALVGSTVAVTAIGAIGIASGKLAIDFDKSMKNVQSLMGTGSEVDASIAQFKTDIKNLSVDTGKSLADLSDGMYQVISAFGQSADSAAQLEIAAKASKAGLATTTDAVNFLSSVTKGYGDTSAEAVQKVADLGFQTVNLGQTTFPELAANMGKAVPLAATLGVKMESLFGAMATLTGVTGNTAEVSTQLRAVFQSLINPSSEMEKIIAGLGFKSGATMIQTLGLHGTLDKLKGVTKGNTQQLADMFGSVEALNAVLALTGQQSQDFTDKELAMMNAAGATQKAFDIQQQSVDAMLGKIKALGTVLLVDLGEAALPLVIFLLNAITPVISHTVQAIDLMIAALKDAGINSSEFAETLQNLIMGVIPEDIAIHITNFIMGIISGLGTVIAWLQSTWITAWPIAMAVTTTAFVTIMPAVTAFFDFFSANSQTLVTVAASISGVAVAIYALHQGFSLAGSVVSVFGTAIGVIASPLGILVITLGLITAAVVLAVQHWDELNTKFPQLGIAVLTVQAYLQSFLVWIQSQWLKVKELLSEGWDSIGNSASAAFSGLQSIVAGAISFIISHWDEISSGAEEAFNTVKSVAQGFADFLDNVVSAAIRGLQEDWPAIQSNAESVFNVVNTILQKAADIAGTVLLPAITNIASKLAEITPGPIEFLARHFDDIATAVEVATVALIAYKVAMLATTAIGAVQWIVGITTAFIAMAQAEGVASAATAVLNGILLINPFVLIAAAITALIIVVVLLVKHWDEIIEKFPILEPIGNVVIGVLNYLKDTLLGVSTVIGTVVGWIGRLVSGLGDVMSKASGLSPILDGLSNVMGKVGGALSKLGSIMPGSLPPLAQGMKDTGEQSEYLEGELYDLSNTSAVLGTGLDIALGYITQLAPATEQAAVNSGMYNRSLVSGVKAVHDYHVEQAQLAEQNVSTVKSFSALAVLISSSFDPSIRQAERDMLGLDIAIARLDEQLKYAEPMSQRAADIDAQIKLLQAWKGQIESHTKVLELERKQLELNSIALDGFNKSIEKINTTAALEKLYGSGGASVIDKLTEAIKSNAPAAGEALASALQPIIDQARKVLGESGEQMITDTLDLFRIALIEKTPAAIDTAIAKLQQLQQTISTTTTVTKLLPEAFNELPVDIQNSISALVPLVENGTLTIEKAQARINFATDAMGKGFEDLPVVTQNYIERTAQAVLDGSLTIDKAKDRINFATKSMGEGFEDLPEAAQKAILKVNDALEHGEITLNRAEKTYAAITKLIGRDFDKLPESIRNSMNGIIEALQRGERVSQDTIERMNKAVNLLPDNFATLPPMIQSMIESIVDSFLSGAMTIEEAGDRIKAVMQSLADSAKHTEEVARQASQASQSVASMSGGGSGGGDTQHTGAMSRYEQGGVAPNYIHDDLYGRPTLAVTVTNPQDFFIPTGIGTVAGVNPMGLFSSIYAQTIQQSEWIRIQAGYFGDFVDHAKEIESYLESIGYSADQIKIILSKVNTKLNNAVIQPFNAENPNNDGIFSNANASQSAVANGTARNSIININGPIYGYDDFRQKVASAVKDTKQQGGFRGIIPDK